MRCTSPGLTAVTLRSALASAHLPIGRHVGSKPKPRHGGHVCNVEYLQGRKLDKTCYAVPSVFVELHEQYQ
jgi:hypothetical protein